MRREQTTKTLRRCKRKGHRKAHDWDDGVADWDTCGFGTGQPPLQFSRNCASFPGGTLAAKQNIQYDDRVVCDSRSLDAVIPDFLFGPLRRRLQTPTPF